MEKSKKGKTIAIVLLSIIILIGVIIMILKLNKKDSDENNNNSNINASSENQVIEEPITGDISSFPQSRSNNISYINNITSLIAGEVLNSNFSKIEKELFDLPIEFYCKKYNEDYKFCEEINITLNSKINYTFYTAKGDLSFKKSNEFDGPEIYKINEYYVFIEDKSVGIDNILITINDKVGDIVYKNTNVKSFYNEIEAWPIISQNTLHFLTSNSEGILKYCIIDLNKSTIELKLLQEFKVDISDKK